jgi:predicted nucleic acid-binding protein
LAAITRDRAFRAARAKAIAAQAVGRKLILVSNNEREFGRVSGLRLENWTQT